MRKLGLIVFCVVFCWLPFSAGASVILKMNTQQMTLLADQIVHGRVVRTKSEWDKNSRRIYTYTTLTVLESLKGKATYKEVIIRQLGGSANGIGMRVPGAAKFRLGEEVVVFLEEKKKSIPQVMGMAYGKYTVLLDDKTKKRYLVQDLKGISVANFEKGKFRVEHAHKLKTTQPVLLESFTRQLKIYLRKAKGTKKTSIKTLSQPLLRVVQQKLAPMHHNLKKPVQAPLKK